MKLAVSGKGGVGKTTLSALLAGALVLKGRRVVAVDADPDANLPSALGLRDDEPITPLVEMRDLIAERTGAKDRYGGYFQLNPRVDDIPEKYARKIGDIRLLVLGGVSKGGGGCICPATALLKALLVHLALAPDEDLVMDMEAGIEHLGRATAQSVDALLVVVESSSWSVQTAHRVLKLARDIGVKRVLAVANRVEREADPRTIAERLGEIPLIGHLPVDGRLPGGVLRAGAGGKIEPSAAMKDLLPAVERILSEVEKRT